jgi:hypothetical protein
MNNEIETLLKCNPILKSPALDGFTTEYCQAFKQKQTPVLLKWFLII